MSTIAQPLDFLGVNNYSRHMASASGPWDAQQGGLPLTEMGWEIYPAGLTDLLLRLQRDYQPRSMLITENGGAFPDPVQEGQVQDAERHAGEAADQERPDQREVKTAPHRRHGRGLGDH